MEEAGEVRPWESDMVIRVDLVSTGGRCDESTFQGEISNSIATVLIMFGIDLNAYLNFAFLLSAISPCLFQLTVFKLS